MKKEIRQLVWVLLGVLAFHAAQAQFTRTIETGDTDAEATTKFRRVLRRGGILYVQAGSWTITLGARDKARANIHIVGKNTTGTDTEHQGAWQGAHIKSTLTMRGQRLMLNSKSDTFKISNLAWFGKGLETAKYHQPYLELTNVVFDRKISQAAGRGQKFSLNLLDMRDGFSGKITQCSFLGFGARAIALNRTLPNNRWKRPAISVARLEIDKCEFVPHWRDEKGIRALSHDAGNDEYPVIWNHGGKVISNSVFTDCGISASKGSNFSITGNTFNMSQGVNDVIHLEEYSRNITISNNKAVLSEDYSDNFLFAGAGNHGVDDITITGNTVEQGNGQLKAFASGKNAKDISFQSNKVLNPVANARYINFFGCGNVVTVGSGQPGLGPDNQNINRTACVPVVAYGVYYIRMGNEYLRNPGRNVRIVEKTSPPRQKGYQWRIEHVRDAYYQVQTVRPSQNYLEVIRGTERKDQTDLKKANKDLTPFYHNNKLVAARAQDAYVNQRPPVWAIFKADNGKYTLVPGGNERLSQLRPGPTGNEHKAIVYAVQDVLHDPVWELVPIDAASAEPMPTQAPEADFEILLADEKEGAPLVFPNPVKRGERLVVRGHQIRHVQVMALNGVSLLAVDTVPVNRFEIDTSNFTEGIVLVRVLLADGFQATRKVLIQ